MVPVPVSYGLNDAIFGTFEGKWKVSGSALILGAPAVDTAKPGKTVAFMTGAKSDQQVKLGTPPPGANLGTHGDRESINVLFADGHVIEMRWTKYSDKTTETGKAQWDPMYDAPTAN